MSDWHGVMRVYDDGARRAGSLRAFWPRPLDREGVRAAWGERDDATATVLSGVRRVPGAPASSGEPDRWAGAFEEAVAAIARAAVAPVVALGGGLDGAAVLAAWRASGTAMPAVTTIATGLAGYDEIDEASAVARVFGVRCEPIHVPPAQIIDAVPEAVPVGEAPLYNLHPIARWVLARELARRGHGTLITGDGGDALFRGRPDHDYVPIVAAYTSTSLVLASPYFAPSVIAATRPDPARQPLRDYVVAAGVADRPKRPRLMPALPLDRLVAPDRIAALAGALDLPPSSDVRWVTLDHLLRAM